MPVVNYAGQLPSGTTLYTHLYCPLAQRAYAALQLYSSVDTWKLEEVDLYGGSKPRVLVNGKVPVLAVEGEFLVTESEDILDFIHEQNTRSMDLGRREEWRSLVNDRLAPAGKKAVLSRDKMALQEVLNEMECLLQAHGTPFLASEEAPSVADCSAFPFIWRINDEFGLDKFPILREYIERLSVMESLRTTVNQPYWWWW